MLPGAVPVVRMGFICPMTMRIAIAGGSDEILIEDQFNRLYSGIEVFRFADGTTRTSAEVATAALQNLATVGNDTITGTSAVNILDGLAGN